MSGVSERRRRKLAPEEPGSTTSGRGEFLKYRHTGLAHTSTHIDTRRRKRFYETALALATAMVPALDDSAANAALTLPGAPYACAAIARTACIDAAPEASREICCSR